MHSAAGRHNHIAPQQIVGTIFATRADPYYWRYPLTPASRSTSLEPGGTVNREQRNILLTLVRGSEKVRIKRSNKPAEGEDRVWRPVFMALADEVFGEGADQIIQAGVKAGVIEFVRVDLPYMFDKPACGDTYAVKWGRKAPKQLRLY